MFCNYLSLSFVCLFFRIRRLQYFIAISMPIINRITTAIDKNTKPTIATGSIPRPF